MPKLPDFRDVGNSSPSSSQRVLRASEVDGSAVGRGIQRAGQVVGQIGVQIQKKNDANDALAADAEWQKLMNEHNRTYDTDPDYQNYSKRFDVAAPAITTEVSGRIRNPELRKKFIAEKEARAEQYRHGHIRRATTMEQQAHLAKAEEAVQSAYNIYTAPGVSDEEKAHARKDITTRIDAAEQLGTITPAAATKLRQKYARELELGDATIRAHENPTETVKEIEEYQKNFARQHGGAAPVGAVKIGGDGVVSIEGVNITPMINPAAPYMTRKRKVTDIKGVVIHGTRDLDDKGNPVPVTNFVKYGQRVDEKRGFDPGYHFYVDRDGTVIQGAPLDRVTNGAKNRNKDQVHVAIIGADEGREATPEQIKVARGLVSGLGTQLGLKPTNVVGHGEVQGNRHHKEGGGVAELIRKEGFAVGAEPDMAGISDPEQIKRAAELRSRYGNLSPQDLMKIQDLARRRQKVSLEVNRQKYHQRLDDVVANIYRTGDEGEPITAEEQRNIRSVLTGAQWDRFQEERKIAQGFVKATGGEKGLREMTNAALTEAASRVPKAGAGLAIEEQILKKVKAAVSKELKERNADPALAVDDHPSIAAFRERVAEKVPDDDVGTGGEQAVGIAMQYLPEFVAARLEAQRDMGIVTPRTITKGEATKLLPNIKDVPEHERLNTLNDAWHQVQLQYGDHAEQVMKDALYYQNMRGNSGMEALASTRRANLTPETAKSVDEWRQSFQPPPEETWFEGEPEASADDVSGGMASAVRAPVRQSAAPAQKATPNVAVYQYAMSQGAKGAAVFDEMYGAGAFARYSSVYAQHASRQSAASHRSQGMPSQ